MKLAAPPGLGIVSLLAGVFIWQTIRSPADQAVPEIGSGYVLDPAKALPSLDLVDGKGMPFTEKAFEGAWSFLYFGYTFCPDACPLSMLVLADVKKRLVESHPDIEAQYYLVSVDPARDTTSRIGEYVAYFDAEFRGLTGVIAEIDKLAKAASVIYSIPEVADGAPYSVGHSSTVTLIDPNSHIRAIFSPPLQADRIATDFAKISASYGLAAQ